jgi:uncharacterized protein
MLISFSIENWRSFKERATFSMVAGREKQHADRVPRIEDYKMSLLPVAAIYGGNASGKTNLFKALNFAKKLIVKGTKPESNIPVEPFRLDPNCLNAPTIMSFELFSKNRCYEFGFKVTSRQVKEEWLTEIRKTTEKKLYHRRANKIKFAPELQKDQFLQFAFQGTRDNQLFITNAVHQKVKTFKPIYDWFRDKLVMIAPDTRFGRLGYIARKDHPLSLQMSEALTQLDTGISRLDGDYIELDKLEFPEELKNRLMEDLKEGASADVGVEPDNERFFITKKNGQLKAQKLVSYHNDSGGEEVRFEFNQESDGTRRAIDLLPAFLDLIDGSERIYAIDELDRSLHTLLSKSLLKGYLDSIDRGCRSQLLFTTHDVQLMDQNMLRRDEMWVTERDPMGCASLIAFSEYKEIRADKDIRKSYLQGRIGGIPRIFLTAGMANKKLSHKSKGDSN